MSLISDLYIQGNLFNILKQSNVSVYETRRKWALQIASAFEYLNSNKIIHRDLKPENILISDKYDAFVADFGFAKRLNTIFSKKKLNTQRGTIFWMAPEILEGQDYDYTVDVYSFGILLYEILFKKRPYLEKDYANEEVFKKKIIGLRTIKNGNESIYNLRPDIKGINQKDLDFNPNKFSQFADLMIRCWHPIPSERPEWKEIISILSS